MILLLACVDPTGDITIEAPPDSGTDHPRDPAPELLPGDTSATTDTDPTAPVDVRGLCQAALHCTRTLSTDPSTCDLTVTQEDGTVDYEGRAALSTRGRSSAGAPKPQYRVELQDRDGVEVSANLLGMGKEDDWILHGNYYDRLLVRNAFGFDLFRDLAPTDYAPESGFCELTLNGELQGVYSLIERVDRDDDRLDLVEDDGTGRTFITVLDDESYVHANNLGYGGWELVYPATDNGSVSGWFDSFEAAFADTPADVFTVVDLDSAVDIVLLEELMRNNDGWYLSLYGWRDDGGPLNFTPWDLDLTLGQPSYNDNENPEGWIVYRPVLPNAFARSDAFRARLVTRWAELREGPLTTEALLGRIDTYQATLGSAIDRNFEAFPIETVDFGGYLHPVSSYAEEDAWVRAFLTARLTWMDNNIQTW